MHRSYVDTAHGQVHVRLDGESERVLLLVHWTPFSGRMYECVAPLFASAGWRVVAPDLLGYGCSNARPERWSVPDWAQGVIDVLDALGVKQAAVLGGHNGASIAAELALAQPERVSRLVLDGVPLMTQELRTAFAGLAASASPSAPQVVLDRTIGLLREYIPGYEPKGDALNLLWPALADYLATGFVSSGAVAAAYDIAERLPLLRCPTLMLGAERDTLASNFAPALGLFQPAASHLFPGHHPIHFPERAREYTDVVLEFLSA